MKLINLLSGIEILETVGDYENALIKNLNVNTKIKKESSLFVCIKGLRIDSHNLLEEIRASGATSLIVERKLDVNLPQIVVKNSRVALGVLANNFYNNPLKNIKLVTIVGTNGKTTTSYLIKDILESSGLKVGVIGTSGNYVNGKFFKADLTTPDTLELFELFNKMKNASVNVIVMELSAHAIKLNKTSGFISDVCVFTNFSQDHLDFFKTIGNYKNTKKSVFNKNFCKYAVINSDDEVGKEILKETKLKALTYGIKEASHIFAINLSMNLSGSSFFINLLDTVGKVNLNLPAKFNVYNSLAAASCCLAIGLSQEEIIKGLNKKHIVNGRFNLIFISKNCYVVIDYAHTPDALENLLSNVKSLSKCELITVLGCPGNRDEGKRAIMGKIASKYSNEVVITSDNPDLENPLSIMDDIKRGVKNCQCEFIENRSEAIEYGLSKLKQKTVLVIAGKGDEPYQIINNIKSPYNDKETLLKLLNKTHKSKNAEISSMTF